MSNVTELRRALRQGVKDFNTGNLPVAIDNADFIDKPTDGSPWLRVLLETGTPRSVTFGHDEHAGYIQIDVNTALAAGETATDTLYQSASNFFKAGRKLVYGTTEAVVRSCARSRGREVDGWWRVSFTVYWDARIDRP